MTLRVSSTLSGQKEPFETLEPGRVRMYVCGPNLYGPAHVGHAFSYVVFDVIRRYLEYRRYQVRHVQNFTDIEDRIIETARAEGVTIQALAETYMERFLVEMDALGVLRAHAYPRATQLIPPMTRIIERLIQEGFAYPADGDVYFRVRSFPDYGRLSRRSLDEMWVGARIEPDQRKEDPLDFALWKAARAGEPAWDSPWGPGRPGWHIECTAMSIELLGEQLDIHGGGLDVLFPHHENEIAQSEAYTERRPFVRYWLHNGLLRLTQGGEKMTRHLGNLITVQEALANFNPSALRLFFLSSHYRAPITWSPEGVRGYERSLERIWAALRRRGAPDGAQPILLAEAEEARQAFLEAMDDDFNTPQAVAQIFELARQINAARAERPEADLEPAQAVLRQMLDVLGVSAQEPAAEMPQAGPFIELAIEVRKDLRRRKEFALADLIRDRLGELGVTLEDTAEGTVWKRRR